MSVDKLQDLRHELELASGPGKQKVEFRLRGYADEGRAMSHGLKIDEISADESGAVTVWFVEADE